MDQPEQSGSGEPNAKRRKENNENDQNASGDDALAVNQEQTADILKMDIDCCEEAFDYLPLEDLISVGKTCKRLQQVAGHCFQQNYSECEHSFKECAEPFAPFIQKIWISIEYNLQYFSKWQSKFRRLKEICVSTDTDCLKKISMSKLEGLNIYHSELSNDIHEIIDQCTNLKHLRIMHCSGELNWLNRKYPTLEHLILYQNGDNFFEGLPAFLELNPNIRKFETVSNFLWEYRDTVMTSNVKLEDLYIRMYNYFTSDFVELLVKLYERGFYEKLQLEIFFPNQEMINRLASLNGLYKLEQCSSSTVALSALNKLEELWMISTNYIADIDKIPNALINLRRIYFDEESIDSIMPFIRRFVEMQAITINDLQAGVYFNRDTGIIDLPAVNRERALLTLEQLAGVQKVTLYVREWIYLATKWAFGETDFKYIKLKRYKS